jgi:hypothetical protein
MAIDRSKLSVGDMISINIHVVKDIINLLDVQPSLESDFLRMLEFKQATDEDLVLTCVVSNAIGDSSRLTVVSSVGDSQYVEAIKIVDSTEFECVPRYLAHSEAKKNLMIIGSAEAIATLSNDDCVVINDEGLVVGELVVIGRASRMVRLEGKIDSEAVAGGKAWLKQGDMRIVSLDFED